MHIPNHCVSGVCVKHVLSSPLVKMALSFFERRCQGDSMYDLHWDEDGADAAAPNERAKAAFQFAPSAADASSLAQRTATVEKVPDTLEVEDGAQVARLT